MTGPNGADFHDPAPVVPGLVPVPFDVFAWPMYVRPLIYENGDLGAHIHCGHCEAELYRFSKGSPETDLSDVAHAIGQHAKVCRDQPR